MLAAVDWGSLLKLIWVAPAAGVLVAVAYGFTILGASRASESRRQGAGTAATLWAVASGVSLLAVLGLVAFAIALITTK